MFGRKKNDPQVIGIHVGRNTLTTARVATEDGVAHVQELFSEPLPRIPAGWPVELVAEKLRLAKRSVNLKAEVARITVASDLAPTYFFVVPPMKGEQLENALKLQLENKWGNAGSDLSYHFQVIEKRGERCRVFAPSIPTERLRLILSSFLDINCHIDSMEVEGVSLANLMLYCGFAGAAPVAALLVCPNWGEVFILSRKRIALSRAIPKLETDTAVGEDGPLDVPEAVADADGQGALSPAYLGRIAREANKTLDYFEIELLAPAVTSLYLVGESAETVELPAFLHEELEIQVKVLDTGEKVVDDTGMYEPALHGLAVAAAIGEAKAGED